MLVSTHKLRYTYTLHQLLFGYNGSYICTDIKNGEEVTSQKWANVIVDNCTDHMVHM